MESLTNALLTVRSMEPLPTDLNFDPDDPNAEAVIEAALWNAEEEAYYKLCTSRPDS